MPASDMVTDHPEGDMVGNVCVAVWPVIAWDGEAYMPTVT